MLFISPLIQQNLDYIKIVHEQLIPNQHNYHPVIRCYIIYEADMSSLNKAKYKQARCQCPAVYTHETNESTAPATVRLGQMFPHVLEIHMLQS